MIRVDAKANIRNRFDIECKDIRTGEVQNYQAHNIILDQMWSRLVNFLTYFSYIRFGTGDGALNPARTSLFNDSGGKSATTVTRERALPTSSWMQQIVINPEEYVGHELTEVGVAYGSGSTDLVTHAFLEDSEGNPISIVKTDTMVVTIYATIFIELGELTDMYGGKFRWVMPLENNELINYLTGYASYPTQYFRVTGAREFHRGTTADDSHGQSSSITTANWIKSAAAKKATTPVRRLGISDGNGAIRGIGLGSSDTAGTFRGQLPIAGVFTGWNIEGEQIGIGDGEETAFNLAWNDAVGASVTVKVDDVAASPTVNELVNYVGARLNTPTLAGVGYGCAFSPDGAYLAVAHYNSPYLTVIDTSDWSVISGTPTLAGNGHSCAFSPDGAYLAVGHYSSPYLTVIDGAYNTGATHNIIFDTPPAEGSIITADYTVSYVPKDVNHVLDLQVTIQYGEET
ncbi:YncE family protein [Candidatus Darwinibacter acetoxidans]